MRQNLRALQTLRPNPRLRFMALCASLTGTLCLQRLGRGRMRARHQRVHGQWPGAEVCLQVMLGGGILRGAKDREEDLLRK